METYLFQQSDQRFLPSRQIFFDQTPQASEVTSESESDASEQLEQAQQGLDESVDRAQQLADQAGEQGEKGLQNELQQALEDISNAEAPAETAEQQNLNDQIEAFAPDSGDMDMAFRSLESQSDMIGKILLLLQKLAKALGIEDLGSLDESDGEEEEELDELFDEETETSSEAVEQNDTSFIKIVDISQTKVSDDVPPKVLFLAEEKGEWQSEDEPPVNEYVKAHEDIVQGILKKLDNEHDQVHGKRIMAEMLLVQAKVNAQPLAQPINVLRLINDNWNLLADGTIDWDGIKSRLINNPSGFLNYLAEKRAKSGQEVSQKSPAEKLKAFKSGLYKEVAGVCKIIRTNLTNTARFFGAEKTINDQLREVRNELQDENLSVQQVMDIMHKKVVVLKSKLEENRSTAFTPSGYRKVTTALSNAERKAEDMFTAYNNDTAA